MGGVTMLLHTKDMCVSMDISNIKRIDLDNDIIYVHSHEKYTVINLTRSKGKLITDKYLGAIFDINYITVK